MIYQKHYSKALDQIDAVHYACQVHTLLQYLLVSILAHTNYTMLATTFITNLSFSIYTYLDPVTHYINRSASYQSFPCCFHLEPGSDGKADLSSIRSLYCAQFILTSVWSSKLHHLCNKCIQIFVHLIFFIILSDNILYRIQSRFCGNLCAWPMY